MHYVSNRGRAALFIFGDIIMFTVAIIALYWSLDTVYISAKFGSVSHGLRISMVWFLMAVPLGFCLIMFRLTQTLSRDIKAFRNNTPVYMGDKLFEEEA